MEDRATGATAITHVTRAVAAASEACRPWIWAVLLFNVLDLAFTIYYIEAGHAVEANPLMAAAYANSPVHFGIIKMALAVLGITLLYRARHARTAQIAIRGITVAYGLLVAYHVAHFPLGQFHGVLTGLML